MTHSFPYTTLFRSPCNTQTWERESHDPRAAGLPLRARPPAGAAEALRDRHPEALGKAWHPPSRVLDGAGRRVEPGPVLPAGLGLARRTRSQVERLRRRPGMVGEARRNREDRKSTRLNSSH